MFQFLNKKPVIYATSAMAVVGCACFVKDRVCGELYRKDVNANDKIVIVTGSNTGIGKETAWELARRGAKVYMACRNLNKCEEARKEIVLDTKNKYVYCRLCDLASLDSVRTFVKQFKKEQNKLHILINNAGVMRTPNSKTKDGFEMQLGVNHLGHFLLTNLLLEPLQAAAPSRIINVSSVAHRKGRINIEDLNSDKKYQPGDAYAQSKLANILFTKELARKLQGTGVTVNAVHPGIVDTEIIRHMSFFNSWLATIFIRPLAWPFVKSPKYGAQPIIFAALDPELEKVTGQYFSNYEQAPVAHGAEDNVTSSWLWSVSEKWTRLQQTEQT